MPSHHLGVPIPSLAWHLPQCTQSQCGHRQNLDMGHSVALPWLQLIMVRHPLMHGVTSQHLARMVLLLLHSIPFVQLILHLLLSMDPIDACSDKLLVHAVKPQRCQFLCCSGCPTHSLIASVGLPRSSQCQLVCSS